MTHNQDIKEGVDQKVGQLKAILYLLQTNLEDFSKEVDRSYELLKVGEKTDLSKQIEDTLDNPLNSIFNLSADIDNNVKGIVHKIASSFIKKNADIINSAFKTKTTMDDLHYSIVLKEDNMDNRNKIFDFFDKYDLLDISSKYPVYFQFVPIELKDKILIEGDVIV
ncbi:MAG: hypothetical protein MI922_08615 [Bacteroidales bacterium]|nr:hypothetical protein [Bacteroidales bacterium]